MSIFDSALEALDQTTPDKIKTGAITIKEYYGYLNGFQVITKSGPGYCFKQVLYHVRLENASNIIKTLKSDDPLLKYVSENGSELCIPKHVIGEGKDSHESNLTVTTLTPIPLDKDESPFFISNDDLLTFSIKNGPQDIHLGSYVKLSEIRIENSKKHPIDFYIMVQNITQVNKRFINGSQLLNRPYLMIPKTNSVLFKSFLGYVDYIMGLNKINTIEYCTKNNKTISIYVPARNVKYKKDMAKDNDESKNKSKYGLGLVGLVHSYMDTENANDVELKDENNPFSTGHSAFIIESTSTEKEIEKGKQKTKIPLLQGCISRVDKDIISINDNPENEESQNENAQIDYESLNVREVDRIENIKFKMYEAGQGKYGFSINGCDSILFIKTPQIGIPMSHFIYPDILFTNVSSLSPIGFKDDGNRIIRTWTAKTVHVTSNMVGLLTNYGLLLHPNTINYWLHMFNDFDIYSRKTSDNQRHKLLSCNGNLFNQEPRNDIRLKEGIDTNPLNKIRCELMNVGESDRWDDFKGKTPVDFYAIISKKSSIDTLEAAFKVGVFMDDYSILDILVGCYKKEFINFFAYHSMLILLLHYYYTLLKNEKEMYLNESRKYFEMYEKLFDSIFKEQYIKMQLDGECPYSIAYFDKKRVSKIFEDMVVAIYGIKTLNSMYIEKKRKQETDQNLNESKKTKVDILENKMK